MGFLGVCEPHRSTRLTFPHLSACTMIAAWLPASRVATRMPRGEEMSGQLENVRAYFQGIRPRSSPSAAGLFVLRLSRPRPLRPAAPSSVALRVVDCRLRSLHRNPSITFRLTV